MSIKVIRNRIFDGSKTYEVGDVITGLSENDESRLIEGGTAELLDKEPKAETATETKGNTIINDEVKTDIETTEVETAASEKTTDETKTDTETATASETIDPNSLAMNTEEYANSTVKK